MKPPPLPELMQFYDGEIEDPIRRREIERWLAQDERGREFLVSLGGLSSVIREAEAAHPPEIDVLDAVMSRIEREPPVAKIDNLVALRPASSTAAHASGGNAAATNANRTGRQAATTAVSRAGRSSSRTRPATVLAGLSVLAAAAALTLAWGASSLRDHPSARSFSPISSLNVIIDPPVAPPSPSAEEEPTAALSGAHVDAVDFGTNQTGSVIYMEGSSGTAVVWVDEGD